MESVPLELQKHFARDNMQQQSPHSRRCMQSTCQCQNMMNYTLHVSLPMLTR